MSMKTFLADQIRLRDLAIARWESCVKKIRVNPNQMNIRGIWIEDFLQNLMALRREVCFRDGIIYELDKPRVKESLLLPVTQTRPYMAAIDKANELAAMLRSESLTDDERYEAVCIVSDAACQWCGSLKGRSCQCTNDK